MVWRRVVTALRQKHPLSARAGALRLGAEASVAKRAGTGTYSMPALSSLDLNTGFVIYEPEAGAARTHHTHTSALTFRLSRSSRELRELGW